MGKRIIDLSYALDANTPVYPNDPPLEIAVQDSTEQGPGHLNISRLLIGLHCGTHMDAPFHFFGEGPTIEQTALERCIGPTLLVHLPNHGAGAQITQETLTPYRSALQETGKVVFHTGWNRQWGQSNYFSEHPVFTGEAAQFLVECGVHLVGVDFPSVDLPPHPAHLVFLGNGVLIVENLTNLDAIGAERFELIALPLKIVGRDGSPVRAIAREM